MKKQVEIIILLFFGFAFLVYLFPVIFVEAAKLQSGVTIYAPPSTNENELICDDMIDNDDDGKIDADDEDCVEATPGTCPGVKILSGVPINYGRLNPGWLNQRTVTLAADGDLDTGARIMVSGGDWISDAPGNPTVFGPEITLVSGKALKSNAILVGVMPSSDDARVSLFFQFRAPTTSGFIGSLHQEITVDLLCS